MTSKVSSPDAGTPPRRGVRILASGAAAFVLLCGLVLYTVGGTWGGEDEPEDESSAIRDVQRALGDARRAERAVLDRNYGDAEDHLRALDRRLSELAEELEGE